MANKQRSDLYDQFVSGTAATEEKFMDLIDSSYNRIDDSLLYGPSGSTGTYGMIGPEGGTYNGLIGPTGATFFCGLFLSTGATPRDYEDFGMTGQVVIDRDNSKLYICDGSYWVSIDCSTSF